MELPCIAKVTPKYEPNTTYTALITHGTKAHKVFYIEKDGNPTDGWDDIDDVQILEAYKPPSGAMLTLIREGKYDELTDNRHRIR